MLTKLLNTFLITRLSAIPLTAIAEHIGTDNINFYSFCSDDGSCEGTCVGCCADGCAGECYGGCDGTCGGTSASHLTNNI